MLNVCVVVFSVQTVPHHFLFLEYMISLFFSPALEQHQYILSWMALGEKPSCCHSLVWSIVCDCGRIRSILWYSEWHVVVWYHHQAVEKGDVSFHRFECAQTKNYLFVNFYFALIYCGYFYNFILQQIATCNQPAIKTKWHKSLEAFFAINIVWFDYENSY